MLNEVKHLGTEREVSIATEGTCGGRSARGKNQIHAAAQNKLTITCGKEMPWQKNYKYISVGCAGI